MALLGGVTPRIQDRGLTAALFGLLTVEARHAAWARHIVGATPAPHAFDEPRSLASVRRAVARTRFVVAAAEDGGDGASPGSRADARAPRRGRRRRWRSSRARSSRSLAAAPVAAGARRRRRAARAAARALPPPVAPAFTPGAAAAARLDRATSRTGRPAARRGRAAPRPTPARARSSRASAHAHARGHAQRRRGARARAGSPRAARGCTCACRCCRTARPAGSRARRSAATGPCARGSTSTSTALRATLYRDGRRVVCARRVARRQRGWETPRGEFYVRNKLTRYRSPDVRAGRVRHQRARRRPRRTGRPAASSASTAPTGPTSCPGRVSHGCIRHAQRRHPRARAAHAGRHAGDDPLAELPTDLVNG